MKTTRILVSEHRLIEQVLNCLNQEDCLFPMIARALPGPEKARLEVALDTGCGDGEEECACNTYIDLANRLADHFDVPRALTADSLSNRSLKESLG
jgi:hypothetical protein